MSLSIKEAMLKVAYRKDGEDHILVTPFAATNLGKYSSLTWRKYFFIPMFGEFLSPMAFMSWLATGDEAQRHATHPVRLQMNQKDENLVKAGYFAKWYQHLALHNIITKQVSAMGGDPFELPWVEYKIHENGLKEFPATQSTAETLKKLARHSFLHGSKNGLKTLDSSVIPGFNLKETQDWLNETVRIRFNLQPVAKQAVVEETTDPAEQQDSPRE